MQALECLADGDVVDVADAVQVKPVGAQPGSGGPRLDAGEVDVADGEFVPGLKTVEGRSSRYFTSQIDAELLLSEAGVPESKMYSKPEFVSPAMAEKLVRGEAKKKLQDFIKSKPGKPCLVSSDDKRKDLTVQSLELLDD